MCRARFLLYLPVLLYLRREGSRGFSATMGGGGTETGGIKAGLLGWMPAARMRWAMRVLAPFWVTT